MRILWISIMGWTLFILIPPAAPAWLQRSDREHKSSYFLCMQLSNKILSQVKISKKETDTGIIIVMTSPNPMIVKNVQQAVSYCKRKNKIKDNQRHRELISLEGINTEIVNLNNGLLIELNAATPYLQEKIKGVIIGDPRLKPGAR